MPMYEYLCLSDHHDTRYFPRTDLALDVLPCRTCGSQASKQLSMGQGLLFFEEGRARLIENITHEPQLVRSAEEHKRLCKKHGVLPAGLGRGCTGQWI